MKRLLQIIFDDNTDQSEDSEDHEVHQGAIARAKELYVLPQLVGLVKKQISRLWTILDMLRMKTCDVHRCNTPRH